MHPRITACRLCNNLIKRYPMEAVPADQDPSCCLSCNAKANQSTGHSSMEDYLKQYGLDGELRRIMSAQTTKQAKEAHARTKQR